MSYTVTLLEKIEKLEKENEALKSVIHEIKEIYIGMDGVKPVTAPEGYLLYELNQIYQLASHA